MILAPEITALPPWTVPWMAIAESAVADEEAMMPVAQPDRASDARVTTEAAKRERADSLIDEWTDTKYLQKVQNG